MSLPNQLQLTFVRWYLLSHALPGSAYGTCKKETTCPVHLHGQSPLKLNWVVSSVSKLLMCLFLSVWAEASG